MRIALLIVGTSILIFTGCRSAVPPERRTIGPWNPPYVDVVIKLRAYLIEHRAHTETEHDEHRTYTEREFEALQKISDRDLAAEVKGFLWEIVSPKQFAGRVLTAHFDGLLASGDPFQAFQFGKSYVVAVPENSIGDDNFRLCY